MSLRPSFPTLENVSTQAGVPLAARVDTVDDAAAANGAIGFSFKNSSGKVVLPQLDTEGRVPVSFQGAGICLKKDGSVLGTGSFQDIAVIPLAISKTYKNLEWVLSCFRDSVWEIVWIDDVGVTDVETILAYALAGSGDFTDSGRLLCSEFTTPGSGDQELRIRAKNENAFSQLRAAISVLELAA